MKQYKSILSNLNLLPQIVHLHALHLHHSIQCPVWGKICFQCKNKNHFATVCHKRNDTVNALNAHVRYHSGTDRYTSTSTNNIEEITISIQPLLPHEDIPPSYQHQNLPRQWSQYMFSRH